MAKGLLVIREEGTPVYFYTQDQVSDDQQVLIAGFFAALHMFAKSMFMQADNEIHSVLMAKTVFTFRTLSLKCTSGEILKYHFVLVTESDNKSTTDVEGMLEYLIVSFMGFNGGDFSRKLREPTCSVEDFSSFDEHVRTLLNSDWESLKKKIRPVPSSLLQGLLYAIRDYIPIKQIESMHPRLVRIGKSYVWLSDDLTPEEEDILLKQIKATLDRHFGPGLYESILKDVKRQL